KSRLTRGFSRLPKVWPTAWYAITPHGLRRLQFSRRLRLRLGGGGGKLERRNALRPFAHDNLPDQEFEENPRVLPGGLDTKVRLADKFQGLKLFGIRVGAGRLTRDFFGREGVRPAAPSHAGPRSTSRRASPAAGRGYFQSLAKQFADGPKQEYLRLLATKQGA